MPGRLRYCNINALVIYRADISSPKSDRPGE